MTTKQKYMTAFFALVMIFDLYSETHWVTWLLTIGIYIAAMIAFRKPKEPVPHN
jgi:hypothetical protein